MSNVMSYLFLDTEFTDFREMDLISIGLVSEDGNHEFYREINNHEPNFRSDFVNQVVIPLLEGGACSKIYRNVSLDLKEWLDSLPYDTVTIVCDYTGDWKLFQQLLENHKPQRVKVIPAMLNYAFLEMLEHRGFHNRVEDRMTAMMQMGTTQPEYYQIDNRQHHALVDAKANRYGWLKAYEYAKANYEE